MDPHEESGVPGREKRGPGWKPLSGAGGEASGRRRAVGVQQPLQVRVEGAASPRHGPDRCPESDRELNTGALEFRFASY